MCLVGIWPFSTSDVFKLTTHNIDNFVKIVIAVIAILLHCTFIKMILYIVIGKGLVPSSVFVAIMISYTVFVVLCPNKHGC